MLCMFRILGLDLAQLVAGLSSGMRLMKPSLCPEPIANLISKCFIIEPEKRPNFEEIKEILNLSKKNLFYVPSRKKAFRRPGQGTYCSSKYTIRCINEG